MKINFDLDCWIVFIPNEMGAEAEIDADVLAPPFVNMDSPLDEETTSLLAINVNSIGRSSNRAAWPARQL